MHESDAEAAGHFMALLHAAGALQAQAEGRLAAVGLSLPKLAALTALSMAGESLPLSQLAERLSCVKSNITQLVDRLEADGLVSRTADPNDRRSKLAVLTQAGREAFARGAEIQRATEQDLAAALGPDDARRLTSLLEKLEQHTK